MRGLEFARAGNGEFAFGLDRKRIVREVRSTGRDKGPFGKEGFLAELGGSTLAEVEELARGIARVRHADAADPRNPLYTRHPETWLESQVRLEIETIDATLLPSPIYSQVPETAGGARGIWTCWRWTGQEDWRSWS